LRINLVEKLGRLDGGETLGLVMRGGETLGLVEDGRRTSFFSGREED